jgi:Alpha/beta hydrolase domain
MLLVLKLSRVVRLTGIAFLGALLVLAAPTQARVTRIVIDSTTTLTGQERAYEQVRGRAFGELDPGDAHNTIITDLALGKDADGKIHYETTFMLTKPVDMAQASGFMWHDVPNRGSAYAVAVAERNLGDVVLASGWQADNAGSTAIPADRSKGGNHWVAVPVARNADGSPVTGEVLGRIVNRSGTDSQPLNVMNNPVPYLPASLDTDKATLVTHTHETIDGKVSVGVKIPSSDWAFAHCDATHPFPGTPDNIDLANLPGNLPVHVCLKNGFDGNLLYQVTYRASGAYLLGVGLAAFRDVNAFFRYEAADSQGTANPVAGKIKWAAIRGISQSGNFTRQFIHQGFNQDESNRIVHEGAWPIIAGRRVAANVRWGQPDGVLELYQLGSEGPQWWMDWPDSERGLPSQSILDRCSQSQTCPRIIEHFGSAEVYALKMTMEWVGTSANADIPLPANVRRYYVPSTTHGGGAGGFSQALPDKPVTCPGNNWGQGTFRANPISEVELVNVLRVALRNWVMNDVPPPPSRYPTLAEHTLVDPTRKAMGFPLGVPGVADSIFEPANFINPVFIYDWGTNFDYSDGTGVPGAMPPAIRHIIAMKVPRVDRDGNELGGVPTVLRDAPLGTYLGWNITAAGFHKGQVCNYIGGMIPFAVTPAERVANHDPRLSLQERYRDHAGYVAAVAKAADNATAQGYLLSVDRDALIAAAESSDVLK